MNRFKAAGIHLLLSALVVAIVLSLMWFVWYPNGFFKLLGGGGLVLIIAGVDLCLGPLLTLVVFNPEKKSLKMDLAIIGIVQVCALLYGASVMFKSRPIFNVFEGDLFKVTLASEFEDDKRLQQAKKPEWQGRSWTGPKLVAAEMPTDPLFKQEVVLSMQDLNMFPVLFQEYDGSQRTIALQNAQPLKSLMDYDPENPAIIKAFLTRKSQSLDAFVYLPIVHGYTNMTAVLDAETADFIEIIEAKNH